MTYGIGSCQADPCSSPTQVGEQGIAFAPQVIGLNVVATNAKDFTGISSRTVCAETEKTLPDYPSEYEICFLELSNQSVLGHAVITVGE